MLSCVNHSRNLPLLRSLMQTPVQRASHLKHQRIIRTSRRATTLSMVEIWLVKPWAVNRITMQLNNLVEHFPLSRRYNQVVPWSNPCPSLYISRPYSHYISSRQISRRSMRSMPHVSLEWPPNRQWVRHEKLEAAISSASILTSVICIKAERPDQAFLQSSRINSNSNRLAVS